MSHDGFKRKFNLVEREEIVTRSEKYLWTNGGKEGLNYLTQNRKISEDTIRKFRLGYVPKNNKHQLCGRIIFPVFDSSNNLIAISSRFIFGAEKTPLPVYWHESYEKSFYLYGLNLAKQAIIKAGFVIVTEGQIDVLQFHANGVENVVGLCANKLSDVQLASAYRYCDEVVLVLDRDANYAGQKATENAMKKPMQAQSGLLDKKYLTHFNKRDVYLNQSNSPFAKRKMIAVEFPMDIDPDDYIKKYGIDAMRRIISSRLKELRSANVYN